MALDYCALVNAVSRLAEGLARYRLDTADAQIRDAHLPPDVSASACGSRVDGYPKPWSDLDIVLDGPAIVPLAVLAAPAVIAIAPPV